MDEAVEGEAAGEGADEGAQQAGAEEPVEVVLPLMVGWLPKE